MSIAGRLSALRVQHTSRHLVIVERWIIGKHRQYWYGPHNDRFGSDRDQAYRFTSVELAERAIDGCLLNVRCSNLKVVEAD